MIDNDRQQKGLADTYIHYFEAQAARTPEATAAVFGGEELSFGELQRRSNQLARYLQMLGVVPEVLVAICLERSLDLLVALLAVWKSGGAYLPLDAAYPNERLAYLLEDSQAGLLITQPQFSSRFRGAQTPLLHLDEALCQAGAASSEKVHCPAQAGNLAYVIYTSGSTGKPKGVEITHRSLLNHNLAILRAYELVGSDRVLQFASLSFDVSIEEIFPSWLSGAAVVLRDNDLVWSIPAFLNCVERQRISVLNLPTAYWHKWVGDLHEMRWPASVRLVIIGGESASVESYRVWRKAVGPGVALINAYEPTEATITSTTYKAGPQDEALAIGAPLPSVRALVLGEDGKPVAADGIGQLYLGGQGVARGYRNRPGLTAERFISSPLPDAPPLRALL
ncbi:MAG TPA: amino acid adenylation domain-containing protein [Verrucomicrobiae bacterium]|nr:amino acid adenylation domain-containing protein [Verrucomicrobiae bacterium]